MQGTHSRLHQWRGSGIILKEICLIKSFVYFCKGLVLVNRHWCKLQNDGRKSLRASLPSAPGYAWRCGRPFQGLPTSPPWTHFLREKSPSETTTKPGAVGGNHLKNDSTKFIRSANGKALEK
jgi:hypothetical protein